MRLLYPIPGRPGVVTLKLDDEDSGVDWNGMELILKPAPLAAGGCRARASVTLLQSLFLG